MQTQRQQQMSSVRKRSARQRQQQMSSVRKRSAKAATAANVFCAKAQCKRSDSNKCFL
ncbi:hypothetical protein [Lysinibacillus sphaericus]|uniref:hypothetical protein n=1 Tax=Lysinibacillus sphaericus TaxID=1421 RepID=UPI001CBB5264|nr:hypothetical protein [Lysinibacillus sphaericus]